MKQVRISLTDGGTLDYPYETVTFTPGYIQVYEGSKMILLPYHRVWEVLVAERLPKRKKGH